MSAQQQSTPDTTTTSPTAPDAPAKRGGYRKGRGGKGKQTERATEEQVATPPSTTAPKSGQKSATSATPISKPPTLSGWGTTNVTVARIEVRRRIQLDVLGYCGLVEEEYNSLQSRHNTTARLIPRALFFYYCGALWWKRALYLKGTNDTLTTQQRAALRLLEQHHTGKVPERINQYLMSMGNFTDGNDLIDYELPDFKLSTVENATAALPAGFLNFAPANANARLQPSGSEMWLYTQLLVPGVMFYRTHTEALWAQPRQAQQPARISIAFIRPNPNQVGGTRTTETNNLAGWVVQDPDPVLHTSWNATYQQLGWDGTGSLPPDSETDFLLSPNTIRWVSSRLELISEYKVQDATKLTSTKQGHFIQAYIYKPTNEEILFKRFTILDHYALDTPVGLNSARSVPTDVVSPSFAFCLRLSREFPISGDPLSAPFAGTDTATPPVIQPLPLAARTAANNFLNSGPPHYNLFSFRTASERRSRLLPLLYQ